MTFDNFVTMLNHLEKNAPDDSTRDAAAKLGYEVARTIFLGDEKNAELFLKLFENNV